MNSNNFRERYFKGRVYITLAPAIFLASCVWFTPNVVATKLAHAFQLYLSLLLFLPVLIYGLNQKLLFRSSPTILHLDWH